MFDHTHYVPILTGKLGEYRALKKLKPEVSKALTPLIEVPPSDWDFENDVPTKTIDELVAPVAENIEKHWGKSLAYLDTYPIQDEGTTATGILPVAHVLNDARSRGLQLVPVTGIGRDPADHVAVAEAVEQDKRGACLRILLSELNSGKAGVELQAVLKSLRLAPKEVDIVVDLGAVESKFEPSFETVLPGLLNALPHLTEWRSLALAASAFPSDLSGINVSSTQAIRRTDWHIWSKVAANSSVKRKPAFSDYAICSPELCVAGFSCRKDDSKYPLHAF